MLIADPEAVSSSSGGVMTLFLRSSDGDNKWGMDGGAICDILQGRNPTVPQQPLNPINVSVLRKVFIRSCTKLALTASAPSLFYVHSNIKTAIIKKKISFAR